MTVNRVALSVVVAVSMLAAGVVLMKPADAVAPGRDVVSVVSTQQYTLTSSDGDTWQQMDPAKLSMSTSPAVSVNAVITANADLWTWNAGFNQDIAVFVDGALGTWKESGGFAGTFSPNAATVIFTVPLAAGAHIIDVRWKTNKPDPGGKISAGAGPIGGEFSPTRLTATLVPTADTATVATVASTEQYRLTSSDGTTWQPLDPSRLSVVVDPAVPVNAMITANTDLWTSGAGINQDVAVFVDGALGAWKESGGFAGTFSPNAATVAFTVPLAAGAHTIDLRWKTNKPNSGGTIFTGAGPTGAQYSPTRLTATLFPTADAATVASVVSTEQHALSSSDGSTWRQTDVFDLSMNVGPTGPVEAVITANTDLWTWNPGFNQDVAVFVDGALEAWKESGGFAGTFSPNAATITVTVPLDPGSHTIDLRWKTNKADPDGKISAGAGPIGGSFSPTSVTALLLPSTRAAWRTASLPPLATHPAPGDRLFDVSCPSASTACVAVGSYDRDDRLHALAGTLGQGTWSPTVPKVPAGSLASELIGVSCPTSATACVAVGFAATANGTYPLVETLIGGTWTPTILDLPNGAAGAALMSVSCPASTSACVAVGSYNLSNRYPFDSHVFVETLVGGAWTAALPNLPAGARSDRESGLDGVSCPTATTGCVAVGDYQDSTGVHPLVETLSGATWTPSTPGVSAPITGQLNGVSCPADVASCVAVGNHIDGSGEHPLVERSAGGIWAPTDDPVPPGGGSAYLTGVSCPITTFACVAVGTYYPVGFSRPLGETLAGGTWTPTAPGVPAGTLGASLYGVSCATTTTACIASGQYVDATRYHALVETLAGGTWTPSAPPGPPLATASLSSTSCPAGSACVAVGRYFNADATSRPLVETLAGSAWNPATPAVPPGSAGGDLSGVSCPAATTACVAVGESLDATGTSQPLVQTLAGGIWASTGPPIPAGARGGDLQGISCPIAPTACTAVGRYVDESGQAHVLVETLNAGTWTPSVPTLPLGADGDLRSVSCPSTTACVAVGVYYDGTNGAVHPLVETLAGGTWTPTTPAVPAGTGYAELQGVSCPTATSGCLAVGAFGDGTGVHPLVDTRAGTAWSASAPMDALPGSFYGVSCPTATTACVAVGQYRGDTPGGHALIVTLDGGAWSRSRPGVPPGLMPGFRGTEVRGVSCPVATTGCWAVGAVDDDNGDLFGLTASNTP